MFETLIQIFIFLLGFLVPYALFRKAKLFSPTINATISFLISLYILYVAVEFSTDLTTLVAYLLLGLFVAFAAALVYKGFKK